MLGDMDGESAPYEFRWHEAWYSRCCAIRGETRGLAHLPYCPRYDPGPAGHDAAVTLSAPQNQDTPGSS
jgi:hypothetical protein